MGVFRGEGGGGGGEGGISQYRGVHYSGGTQVVQASWPRYIYIYRVVQDVFHAGHHARKAVGLPVRSCSSITRRLDDIP